MISSFDYGYDKGGNRLSVVEAGGERVTWTYDRTYQLLTEARSGAGGYTHTFSYDPVGNRLTKDDGTTVTTSVYDDANRLQTAEDGSGVTTYTFDANGNQRTQETPAGDVTTYVWDYENQMASLEDAAGAVTTYTYTAAEQRVGKETDAETVKFLWDGQNIVQEYDELDVTQADYTNDPQPAPHPFGNLVSQRREMESSFYSFDALGSTRNLTDDAEVETDDYAYEAFGKVAASSGTTENPFQWVGAKGVFTQEDERRWMRAREMDAASGRFMSEDPARDDSNLYRYTGNNPASRSDPSGLDGPFNDLDALRSGLERGAPHRDLLDQTDRGSLLEQLSPVEAEELRNALGLPPHEDENAAYERVRPLVEGVVTQLDLIQLVGGLRPTQEQVDLLVTPAGRRDPYAQLLLMTLQVLDGRPDTGRRQPYPHEIDEAVEQMLGNGVGRPFFGGDLEAAEGLIREILMADAEYKRLTGFYREAPVMTAAPVLTRKEQRVQDELREIEAVLNDKTATDMAVTNANYHLALLRDDQATQTYMGFIATRDLLTAVGGAGAARAQGMPLQVTMSRAQAKAYYDNPGRYAPPPEGFQFQPHVRGVPVGPDALPPHQQFGHRGMRSGRVTRQQTQSLPRAASLFPEQHPLQPSSSQNPLVRPSLNNWAYFQLLRSQTRAQSSTAAAGPGVLVGRGTTRRTFRETGTGTNLLRYTRIGGQLYRINSGHGYDRAHTTGDVRSLGLSRDQVENAILDNVHAFQSSGGVLPTSGRGVTPYKRTITVDGHRIRYEAVRVPVGPAGFVSITNYYPIGTHEREQ